ncbi:putative disease resistance protein RGA1 isoform X2 [Prosopis cineraria]|uniref:putative disease resistance protein RGA1 isoform X2 n=1 Tax=Prosopis cineraria TaxID=364024 RepID=UPI00240F25BE|nr:putative disease resistance protein RGA1 isoform X2 [Prosopis cineraria]
MCSPKKRIQPKPDFYRETKHIAETMAAELVGGAFLSAALQVAFDRLSSTSVITHYFRSRKLEDSLLKKLHITLIAVNQVLDDAEARQYTNPNVKKWLHELKHAVYVADDLLDEIATEATRLKFEAENQTATSKARGFFTFVNPFDKHVEARIQEVLDDLEFLAKQKDALRLKEGSGGGCEIGVGGRVSDRLPTTSLVVDDSSIYGRDGDKEQIIELLLDDDLSRNPLSVISIVGMGGLGKTTLAQLVYNDARMEDQFQLKAWVCISEEFDVVRITKTILSALGCSLTNYEDLNQLQLKLKEKLMGKKFLLVLDDVWNERQSNWEALQIPFSCGDLGSKILVTTRSGKVASIVGSIRLHRIPLLNEEDGRKMWMAEELLHCHQGKKSMKEIGNEVLSELKSRSFFQNSRFGHDKLIMHDLLNDLANSISDGFCSRVEGGNVQHIQRKIRYFSCSGTIDNKMLLESICECKLLHGFLPLSPLQSSIVEGKDVGEMLSRFKHLRILDLQSHETINKLGDCISNLKHLRYLDLSHTRIEKLPDSICIMYNLQTLKLLGCNQIFELPLDLYKLINLRYLDLSQTRISKLPDSLCKLHNLHTLKLRQCSSLVDLPPNFDMIINLHHLDLHGTNIREMPMNIGRLKHLKNLTAFYVGKQSGSNTKELGKLNYLQGCLQISQLENINDAIDAREAKMKDKKYLNELYLKWIGNNEDSQNERSILEVLQPHVNLKKLFIHNYGGTRFANWIDSPYLPNLVSLELRACKYCFCLPSLGQLPSLKMLHISQLEGIKKIGLEFYGENLSLAPFPSLEYFHISDMGELEEWMHFDGGCFPCLNKFSIRNCPILRKSLPLHLPCLEYLQIEGCQDLELESFPMTDFSYPKLEWISLSSMTHFKSLHEDMHALLPSLRYLQLYHCPQLQLVSQRCLPSSLVHISIHDCPKLIASRMRWGLHRLHSLRDLLVGAHEFENVESFLEEEHMPPNLKCLYIDRCSNLTKINNNGLLSLTSLQCLHISNCPNLQCLPEEGLPKSLSQLWISGNCTLLKQQYQKEDGPGWPIISHIRLVFIG